MTDSPLVNYVAGVTLTDRRAVALAYFGRLRKKDVVDIASDARAVDATRHQQSENGIEITIFEANQLSDILYQPDDDKGKTIVRRQDGAPYTRDGLDGLFQRLKEDLVEERTIRPSLTFHGFVHRSRSARRIWGSARTTLPLPSAGQRR